MYKRFLLAVFMVLSLVVSPLMSSVAQALSPLSNALIKLEGSSSVYWLATDNKRYVFPNSRTFTTWFSESDFSRVITLSPEEMGRIALGGNVTYRPGVRLIKITTDPRVYAVSRYGTLRWITSEALAVQLYGYNWAQQVDDVPDEYFTNYQMGDAIYNTNQFNVAYETGLARTPSDNIPAYGSGNNNPNNSINGSLELSLSNLNPSVGDTVTFTARLTSSNNSSDIASISIYSLTGETLRTCTYTTTCTYDWYMSSSMAGFGRTYYARATHRNGQTREANAVTLQVRGTAATNGRPSITVNNTYPRVGDTVTFTATTNDLNTQQGGLAIATHPDGTILQSCPENTYSCTYSFVLTEAIAASMRNSSQGSYGYYARFFYSNRNIVDSPNVVRVYPPTIGGTSNNQATAHTLTFSQSTVRPGEAFTVTSRLTPDSTSAPYYTIRIYDQWNVLQHTCYNVRTCVLQQNLSSTADTSRTYYASATADNGHSIGSGNATVTVIPSISTQTNGRLGTSQLTFTKSSNNVLTLTPEMTLNSGSILRIGALVEPQLSNTQGVRIILSDRNGSAIQTCTNSNNCSGETVMINTGSTEYTAGYKARIEDAYGSWYETPVSQVIVRTTTTSLTPFSATLVALTNTTTTLSNDPISLIGTVSSSNVEIGKLGISWYNNDGTLLKSCFGTTVCNVDTTYTISGGGDRVINFYFIAWDISGTKTGTLTSNVVEVLVLK